MIESSVGLAELTGERELSMMKNSEAEREERAVHSNSNRMKAVKFSSINMCGIYRCACYVITCSAIGCTQIYARCNPRGTEQPARRKTRQVIASYKSVAEIT